MNGGNLLRRLSHDLNGFRVHDSEDTGLHSKLHPQKVCRFPFPFRRVAIRGKGETDSNFKTKKAEDLNLSPPLLCEKPVNTL
jgi:hypothetical protein